MQSFNFFQTLIIISEIGSLICDRVLAEQPVQELIHSDEHFDLVIMAAFYVDCFLGFAHKFKAPVVQLSPFGGPQYLADVVGNPNPYAFVPDVFRDFSDKMSFSERVMNTIGGLFQQIGRCFYIKRLDNIMRKHFNYTSNMPSIRDLEKSTALVLVNHHFSISYSKPMVPNYVQVGGMHVKPPKSLPAASSITYTLCMDR
jgi:glucuronosyltransferase